MLLTAAPGSAVIAVELKSQRKHNHFASAIETTWPENGLKMPPGVLKVAPRWLRARIARLQTNDLEPKLASRQHRFASAAEPGWRLPPSRAFLVGNSCKRCQAGLETSAIDSVLGRQQPNGYATE